MEVAGLVSSTIGLWCSLHEIIRTNCKHFRTPNKSIRRLNNLVRRLDAHKADIEHVVNQLGHLNGVEPTDECKLWFERVDQIKTEVSSLMDENGPHRPTKGCCFICSRITLGKLIDEKIRDIRELLENDPRLVDSIVTTVNKIGDVLSTTPMMEYGTHKKIYMKIWGFLHDRNVRRIGVWGMGGAGKTTILSEINNRLVGGTSQFKCIIWAEASKDLKKVQQDIAVKLGLSFLENDDGRARASKLLEAFSRRKPFALILDDVWEPFSIEEVGILMPTVENGCKLVIITRSLRVCRKMEIDKDVEVKVLSKDEAWNLFQDKAGKRALSDPNVQSIAMHVAEKCGGLPLAIVAVGLALRNKMDKREWENALQELSSSSIGTYEIDEGVCSCLKLSYSKLKDDTRRSCFLFCALYPKGHLIDENELINFWMWEDLLGGLSMTMMKRRGQMIIDELISACLLESKIENNGVRCVKLHDLVRDMAITIMSMEPRCVVNAGMGEIKPPSPQEWRDDVRWVSLMRNDVKSIGFSPLCPRLTSLLLQYNSFEKQILDNCFDNMQGLKVLDLSYSEIIALPVSFSNLKNLCALVLSHCYKLLKVPSLAGFTELKYLDFSFSRHLTELPEGVEQLTNLRHLNFSFTSIQNLKAGVISKFTLLEELLTLGSPMFVVSSKDTKHWAYPVGVEDIISCCMFSLVHMQVRISIAAYKRIAKCLNFSQLNEFKLVVGFHINYSIPKFIEKASLAIDMTEEQNLSEAEITELIPRNVMELEIRNSDRMIKRLSLHLLDAMCLKTCTIICFKMECILESEENHLSQLERMNINGLLALRMICGNVVKPNTLMNLKSIHVEACSSLKCLFPRQLMLELKSLEEITISGCDAMEEIIEGERNSNAEDNNHAAKVILPKLQKLKLKFLPNLKSIYKGDIQCDSLRTIKVFYCDALKKLPQGLFGIEASQQMSPSTTLEEIKGEKQWWESLQWDQPEAKHLLQPYFVVHPHSRQISAPSSSNTA